MFQERYDYYMKKTPLKTEVTIISNYTHVYQISQLRCPTKIIFLLVPSPSSETILIPQKPYYMIMRERVLRRKLYLSTPQAEYIVLP